MTDKWENNNILEIEASNFLLLQTSNTKANNTYHIDIDFHKDYTKKTTTFIIDNWFSNHTFKDIIIKDIPNNKIYFLESGHPKNIIIGINSYISSCEFYFKTCTDISRKYKILKILSK